MTKAAVPFLLLAIAYGAPRATVSHSSTDSLPWYMQETAMSARGRLTFLDKMWWPRAKALPEGGSFNLDLNQDGRPDTVVERKDGNLIEIIDDSGRAADIVNNKASAAYIVSLGGTGLVDRMVVYIDNDNDGKADEMELRYYQNGFLRYAWFSENYDPDGTAVFTLRNWSYDGNPKFDSKFRGNVEFYLNKFDPQTGTWEPFSECPFVFWDPNHDGRSETVLRVSAAPLDSNAGKDADYANNYQHIWAKNAIPLSQIGNMNVRFSMNLDPEPRRDPLNRPHYTFGFNLVGSQPYNYPGMRYTNPRRRPPQTVIRLPRSEALSVATHYPAQQTGFSWDEARTVFRWEGQFWIYERDYMPNTGGPTMRWNMRREYSPKFSRERQLYYSAIDKRYHLLGAREGWLEVGHLVTATKDLEFRYFDSDGDGYFDTWEVFEGSDPVPVRRSHTNDARVRLVSLSRELLRNEYNIQILPSAIADDQRLISVLKKVVNIPLAAQYEREAEKTEDAERRRYCLDVARELYFIQARDSFYARNAAGPYSTLGPAPKSERLMTMGPVDGGFTLGDTLTFWRNAKKIDQFVDAYANGKTDEAVNAAEELIRDLAPRSIRGANK